jgi:predicted O-methyltransferase YrrM
MALPRSLRRLAPVRLRDDVRLRALAVGSGLIPPRTMHSAEEAQLLAGLAASARRIVEIGVYEGASAAVLIRAMPPGGELHLIDPFGHHPSALPAGWGATEWASRRVVARARRRARVAGERSRAVVWHVALSEQVASGWSDPVDLVFVDGDHSEEACELDWEHWSRFVAPGGHLVFHDARADRPNGRGLPGPTAVVARHFRSPGAEPGWRVAAEVDRTVVVQRADN